MDLSQVDVHLNLAKNVIVDDVAVYCLGAVGHLCEIWLNGAWTFDRMHVAKENTP